MPFNFVVQILQVGFIGLAFLLAFMAYRLLGQQSARETPQIVIVRLISRYMWFALALSLLAVGAQATQLVLARLKPGEIEALHSRIDGIQLHAEAVANSPGYDCGNAHNAEADSLVVMYGLRDGTSCGVRNVNYYKRLSLSVPARR